MNKWILPGIIVAVVVVAIAIIASVNGCPADVRVCPDGSYVARTGLNCEFAQCPEANCAAEGEYFSETKDCCFGLVKAVATCEKCVEEGKPLAFDGIPCCEGLESVGGFCRKP